MSTDHLAVVLDGAHVADVERTRAGVLRLTYLDAARHPDATPLSLSLPPTVGSHVGSPVERFLTGLLPESEGALHALARRHRIDTSDPLAVLAVIGKDCAGAVQFATEADLDATLAREGSLVACSASDIESRLAEMDTDEDASWTMPGEHWSLGGTQQKFALRRQDDCWFVAHGAEPTTHIIKPGIRSMRAQALAEHLSMRAAAILGHQVADTTFTAFKSQDAVVVTRFDRVQASGEKVVRVHQEDMCQALGNGEKYEEYGGPSALEIIRLLRATAPSPAAARTGVGRFLDALIFNTVVGAADAHARNYSVLLSGQDVRLAPLYDVASGFFYDPTPGTGRVTSMSVGGTFALHRIDQDAWRRLAARARLDEQQVLDRVAQTTALAPGAFAAAVSEVDDPEGQASALGQRWAAHFHDWARSHPQV